MNTAVTAPAVWPASLSAKFYRGQSGKTQLGQLAHQGPMRVQRLFHDQQLAHCYVLHPPGGMVSGDSLTVDLSAEKNTQVLVTTPASGKLYRARPCGTRQCMDTRLRLDEGVFFAHLPQDTIVFNDARGQANLEVDLPGDATYLGWDHWVFGRQAGQQPFDAGSMDTRIRIRRGGALLYQERIVFEAEAIKALPALQSYVSHAALTLVCSDAQRMVASLRDSLESFDGLASATAVRESLVIVRLAAHRPESTRLMLEDLWQLCGAELLGRPVTKPRIWST